MLTRLEVSEQRMPCQGEVNSVLTVKGHESSFNLTATQTSISRSLARFSSLISEYLENLDSVISSLTGLEYKWCSSDLELWVSSSSSLSSSWLWNREHTACHNRKTKYSILQFAYLFLTVLELKWYWRTSKTFSVNIWSNNILDCSEKHFLLPKKLSFNIII